MNDASSTPGFPYLTVIATLAALFLFLGLGIVVYRSPNYLGEPPAVSSSDAAEKSNAVQVRNQAVLDGTAPGVRMPIHEAAEKLSAEAITTKSSSAKHGRLPFPIEPKMPEKKTRSDAMSAADAIIVGTLFGSIVLFGGAAVIALSWAFRTGQFENFDQGSRSIFGPDEPIDEPTDAFPQ